MNIAYLEIIKRYDWNFKKHLYAENLSHKEYDYIILGNSLVMDAVDTELLSKTGYSSFNFGIGGATLKSSKLQLESYILNENKKPKKVVLGLGKFLKNDQLSDLVHPVIKYTQQQYWQTLIDIPLLKYSWMATEQIKQIVSSNHRNAKVVNGQLRISKSSADITFYSNKTEDKFNSSEYLQSIPLIDLAKFCQKNDIELVIMEMPGYKKYQNNIAIGPYILEGNGYNMQLYNFNNREFCEIFDDKKDWLGNAHLNRFGAIKFTNEILKSKVLK